MNPMDNVKKFQKSMREAVAVARCWNWYWFSPVSLRNLIIELEEQKFKLQMTLFSIEQDNLARETADAIIPVGNLKIPRKINGN